MLPATGSPPCQQQNSCMAELQILTLFLTLDIATSNGGRLAQHPEWKQALNEEPLFRSFQFARTLPPPTRDDTAVPTASPNSSPMSLASITGLGVSLYNGVKTLSRRVIPSGQAHEPTGDPEMDNALSQVAYFSDRARKCASLLCRVCTVSQALQIVVMLTRNALVSLSLHSLRPCTSARIVCLGSDVCKCADTLS